MPNNNNQTLTKSKVKSKSQVRKPLRDVSNAEKYSSKSTGINDAKPYKEEEQGAKAGDENGVLDRLFFIHSDISSLINQINELVVQALGLTSRKATKEVESFANFLSEMQDSLKPWIPRFKALFDESPGPENLVEQSVASEIAPANAEMNYVESPEQTTMVSLVSPSPLVSWRADGNIEHGRQLFLLTPLPRSKELLFECDENSKSMLKNVTSRKSIQPPIIFDAVRQTNDNILEGISVKPTPCKTSDCNLETKRVSPENFVKTDGWMLGMTPCLKISPPRTCVVLEPISEITKKGGHAVYKSTPFPLRVEISEGYEDSESSSSKVSEHTSVKYPDFLGIKFGKGCISRRKAVEESPIWLMSPPKSCVLMEPPDDKILLRADIGKPSIKGVSTLEKEKNLLSGKKNDVQDYPYTKITCKRGVGGSCGMVDCTPMLKEARSTIQRGKHPGENTLKKELWTKFEAASTNGIGFNVSFLPKTATQKGFLARLDEVS